jgi:acetylornithine deacetylase/succinyl-diaminopimelate desuccinylase-like protein
MRNYVERTLADLVGIASVNPRFAGPASGGGGERQIVEHLDRLVRELGFESEILPTPSPERPSLLARKPGSGGGRSLMLNGHVDTVGVETMKEPFRPRVEGPRLYGRGAYDMKGGLAACLGAAVELERRQIRLAGDLWLSAVADEEDASAGAHAIAERLGTDGVIVTEPTHLVPVVAHKGFVWIEVTTRGFACHGSRADRGVDANRQVAVVLEALDTLEAERAALHHPLLGAPSLHVGRIEGGLGASTYSPSCRVTIELRTLPGESPERLVGRLAELMERGLPDTAAPEAILVRPPLECPTDGDLASTAASALREVTGAAPAAAGVAYWTDAAVFARTSGEVLLLGPGGDGAHEDVEWADLDSVADTARVLARVAESYCGTATA